MDERIAVVLVIVVNFVCFHRAVHPLGDAECFGILPAPLVLIIIIIIILIIFCGRKG